MATFEELRRQTHVLAQDISNLTGVAYPVVNNIIQYARTLTTYNLPDKIDNLVFVAQMGHRFGLTSILHVRLMFDALKVKKENYIRLEDYVRLICIFASAKIDLKINFVFSVYDTTRVGYLDQMGMTHLLKTSIITTMDDSDPHEALKELIDMVISVFDSDHDGRISLEEYRTLVKNNILYIQLLGQVLPNEEDLSKFMNIMRLKSPLEVRKVFESERSNSLSQPTGRRNTLLEESYPVLLDMP